MGKAHRVKDGEDMASIAQEHGFRRWESIYYHGDNKPLRTKRPAPNLLRVGDEVTIPDFGPRNELCTTGQRHRFQLRAPQDVEIHLVLEDEHGVMGNAKFVLEYKTKTGAVSRTGYTGLGGEFTHRFPVEVKSAELTIWRREDSDDPPLRWTLDLGDMDPLDTVTGCQDRLRNLGYDLGEEDGSWGEKSKAAIRHFQQSVGFEATGDLDNPPETRQMLREQSLPRE